MNIKSLFLSLVLVAILYSPSSADPIDSLVNIVKWNVADGGNGHTYAFLKMTITWDSARVIVPTLAMDSMSGHLATITSQQENDFILNNVIGGAGVQPVLAQQFFLGGEEHNLVWSWLNGEPFIFTNWAPGEPNNEGIETALSMWGFEQSGQPAGKWNNTLPNLVVNPYIRQWSVVEWDESEDEGSADSLVKITKWEKSNGGNGHTYAILKKTLVWDSANSLVPTLVRNGKPAYLASITSQEENDFIQYQLLEGMPKQTSLVDQYFTGGIYENNEWVWQTGEPFDYTNWAPTEPNNVGIEIVTSIWGYGETDSRRPAGKWNNTVPNQNVNPYGIQWSVVEWDEPDLLNTILEPNLLDVADSKPRDSVVVSIYLMDFLPPYTSSDIEQNSLKINGHLEPLSVTSASAFDGAIKIDVLLHNFLNDYVILWDTATLNYTVIGSFKDNTPFNISGTFQAIGHNPRDSNPNSNVSMTDLIILINMLYRGESAPGHSHSFDFDGSCGEPGISDLLYLIDFLYRGGPPPKPDCTE